MAIKIPNIKIPTVSINIPTEPKKKTTVKDVLKYIISPVTSGVTDRVKSITKLKDDSTAGVIYNTITGLPEAARDVAKSIPQYIAGTIGSVGTTAGNLPTQINNRLTGINEPLPYDQSIPTDQNKVTKAIFGGRPINTVQKRVENTKEFLSPYIGKTGGNLSALPLVGLGIALDLTGWGGSKGVKSWGEVPEAFFKFMAKEKSPAVIEKTLGSIGLDAKNAKYLAEDLAATETIDQAKNVLSKYKSPIMDVAVQDTKSAIQDQIAFLENSLAEHPGRILSKFVSRTTGELPEVTGKRTMSSLTGSRKTVKTSEFGKREPQEVLNEYKGIKNRIAELKAQIKNTTPTSIIGQDKGTLETAFASKEREMALRGAILPDNIAPLTNNIAPVEPSISPVTNNIAPHLKFDASGNPLPYTAREKVIVARNQKESEWAPDTLPFLPATNEERSLMGIAEQAGYADPRVPQAREDLEKMIAAKQLYKWNNVREAMAMPDLPEMSFDQIKQLEQVLSQYPKKTEFLTTRQLQTIHRTKLAGMRTVKEVLDNLKKVTGTVPSDVITSKPHPWMYDTQIYRQDPFWKLVLDTYNPLYLKSTTNAINIQNISNDLIRAARKSRKRSLSQRLVPTDDLIVKYLQSPAEERVDIVKMMTPEEYKAAQFQDSYNREVYDWKMKEELEKKFTTGIEDNISRFKDVYFHHTARPFLETWKDDGFKAALKESVGQFEQQEAVANILNEKTGDILPYDKWVGAFQFRTGKLTPSKNAALAFNTYVSAIEKAKLFNEIIPELMMYAHTLGPRLTTSTGLEVDDTLQMGLRKWINTKKGRVEKQIITPGSRLDWAVRTGITLLRIRDLGLNLGIQLASPFGEQAGNIIMLRSRYPIAVAREMTKQGERIARKYENFVGKRVSETIKNPDKNIGEKIMGTVMGGFSSATRSANKMFLLGSMTREEFRSGTISPERLAQLRIEMGRFRNVHDAQSVFGKSAEGKTITQYKQWAIPALTTTASDFRMIAKIIKQKGAKEAMKSREFKELLMMALLSGGILLGSNSYYKELEKKGTQRTFIEDAIFKITRDSMSMLGALDPQFIVGFAKPRLVSFFVDLATAMTNIAKLEEYQIGENKGELKGPQQLMKILTPVAVSQFIKENKGGSSSGGINVNIPNIEIPDIKIPEINIPEINI